MVKRPVAAGGENGPNTIFKATYSGVPVFEMICRTVAVMRRRSDSWLNATQILKVASFDKPQRTRILEREVQKGEHEKVQGGYGKYQGTWIPIERGLALAKQYGVEDLLRPIIDYVPTSVSPPPAPKHAVAPPTKKKDKEAKATPVKGGAGLAPTLSGQFGGRAHGSDSTPQRAFGSDPDRSMRSADESLSQSPGDDDSSSETPSPVASPRVMPADMDMSAHAHTHTLMDVDPMGGMGMDLDRKRTAGQMMDDTQSQEAYAHLQHARGQSAVRTPRTSPRSLAAAMPLDPLLGPEQYTDIILNYFISETSQIPSILISPPENFNPNLQIDDDGHAPLHWAAAMGRVRIVKLLLTAGASIFASNASEQTPLMRAVMFSNNYDVRKFPELYELLHRSTLNIDRNNRTVFHHIANLALTKGKTRAARYYMETILSRLADYPQELADVINFQDDEGETALTLASRARSRGLVRSLLDHGADPKIKNRDFKSAEDYIVEDERFRSSPAHEGSPSRSKTVPPVLYHSESARLVGGSALQDVTAHLQSLARSFDAELQGKERDILQAKALLTSTHTEITESSRLISALSEQVGALESKKQELQGLQSQLEGKLREALRAGYEGWLVGEEAREDVDMTKEAEGGEEESLRWEADEKKGKREELVRQYAAALAQAPGSGGNIAKYKKLIAASSGGNVSEANVDGLMDTLLETMEHAADVKPQATNGL